MSVILLRTPATIAFSWVFSGDRQFDFLKVAVMKIFSLYCEAAIHKVAFGFYNSVPGRSGRCFLSQFCFKLLPLVKGICLYKLFSGDNGTAFNC